MSERGSCLGGTMRSHSGIHVKLGSHILACLAAFTVLALPLAGCAASGPFDALPREDLPGGQSSDAELETDSLRLLGIDQDGVSFYVAEKASNRETCLLAAVPGEDEAMSCGGAFPITLTYADFRASLSDTPAPTPPDSGEAVGDFLIVSR